MKYSLGLDIGVTSVGWAVLDEDKQRFQDVGVRIFEKPEDPQSGKSLAEPRRTARSARRRLRRRRQRLNTLKNFFADNDLLTHDKIEEILAPNSQYDPYVIRQKSVKDRVSNEELFIALYHIAKRRGYKSNRRVLEEKDEENSRVLSAISENAQILHSLNTNSVATALVEHEKFSQHKRNKRDSYKNSFVRQNFEDEAKEILKKQKEFGLTLNDDKIRELLYGNDKKGDFTGIFSQRPFMTTELIEKMRGECELEPGEPRAPKASLSFEMFRLAQNLSHLKIVVNGATRSLTKDEINEIVEKARGVKTLKYHHIREVLGYKNNEAFNFGRGMIRGKIKKDDKSSGENNKFDELTFYHAVKNALKDSPGDWQMLENNQELFDKLGYVLTVNKDDENLRKEIKKLGMSDRATEELLKLNFNGFGHLSLKALDKITPFLLKGETYDRAVELADTNYSFVQKLSGDKTILPPLSQREAEQITNPVVKRALSQTIKVINAVIRKYGAPNKIKIEAASELAKNFNDRQKIEKLHKENAERNEGIKNRLETEFKVVVPTGLQITKFKLYEQQNGKCMYSGKALDLDHLFSDERYAEIDHIIPFSRCGNDSLNNKVLVLTSENQNKGNLTPYEAWGSDETKWNEFEARVAATFLPFAKKDRLIAKSKPEEEWNARALNDTRYISRFLRKYIRENLKFVDIENEKGKQRVITPSGPITSYLRRVWRIGSKNREDDVLHHATDACVIAAIDQSTIQKVSRLNKYYELFQGTDKNEITDKITGEVLHRNELEQHIEDIQPWEDFGKEVRKRTALYSSPSQLHNELEGIASYDEEFRLSSMPIFVSRMPKRSGKGPTNKDTIRSPKVVENYENAKGEKMAARKQRIPLAAVNLKTLENSPVRQSDPKLYMILKQRLEANGDDPGKAFAEKVYKPTKNGERGNIVRNIKVYDTQNSKSGFYSNSGKAFMNNGKMVRLDIYQKANKKGKVEHFFVPVYTHQIPLEKKGQKITKILPEPKGFTDIDETFTEMTSLFPNDYVRIYFGNKIAEGYYVKYGSASGQMVLIPHHSSSKDTRQLIACSARSAVSIERFDISILGDNAPRA